MASAAYQLFREAILHRKQVICFYRGKRREVCPHILGHTKGQEKALTYQYAGESNSKLPPGGEWRCLSLADVRVASLREGPWHTGDGHRTTQSCVEVVDIDVNR